MMIQIADDLEIEYLFAHADEAINSKKLMISWENQDKYDKIIPLIGGFHTIIVNLKILFKKYGCLGLSDWWVDAGAIADGSAAQAIEGRHYARSVRLHKQSFKALIRKKMQVEAIRIWSFVTFTWTLTVTVLVIWISMNKESKWTRG